MNFEKPIQEMDEKDLLHEVNRHTMGGVAMGELTRRSTNDLKKAIESLDKSTTKYNKHIIGLTVALLVLGLIQLWTTIYIAHPDWRGVGMMVVAFSAFAFGAWGIFKK